MFFSVNLLTELVSKASWRYSRNFSLPASGTVLVQIIGLLEDKFDRPIGPNTVLSADTPDLYQQHPAGEST
jgi:hypothetical protein